MIMSRQMKRAQKFMNRRGKVQRVGIWARDRKISYAKNEDSRY